MAIRVPDMLSLENELFRTYIFHCSVLVIKMLIMSILTGIQRFWNLAFINPEDTKVFKLKAKTHEDVERVRRAHLNDLENIPVFFVASFVYILTNPSVLMATFLFRVFTVARIIHSFVYAIYVIPQPARVLSFGAGYLVTIYMALIGILNFC